jgi:hypothetical protein
MAGASPTLYADDHNEPPPPPDQPELLLIRAWNPTTGELVGWMPMHRMALTLQRLGGRPASFDLNEAVAVRLSYRPQAAVRYGEVRAAPDALTFQGHQWLPAERDPNIVYVRGVTFYVKSMIFGDSKWRRPSAPSAVGQTLGK